MGRIGLCVCSFIIVHFAIEHQVYHDWKFKEQHAKIWENIVGAKRYTLTPVVSACGGERPAPAQGLKCAGSQRVEDLAFSNVPGLCRVSLFTASPLVRLQ